MTRYLLAAVLVACVLGCDRKPTPPDVIFDQKGTYVSPNEVWSVEIKNAGNGEMRYRLVFSNGKAKDYINIPANKQWFMCWDSRDRLWIHVPDLSTTYWYSTGVNQAIPHEMNPPTQADLTLMPKAFRDKLPDKLKPKPTPRPRR